MAHWINIEEGSYFVEAAFLMNWENNGVALEEIVVEIYLDKNEERRLRGQAMAINAHIVELLEDHDEMDLLLDFGGEFKYMLKAPSISGGKVFSPDVKSLIHFAAKGPVEKLSGEDYRRIRSKIAFVGEQRRG